MRYDVCERCGGKNIRYVSDGKCFCNDCNQIVETSEKIYYTPYERTRNAVYATGNKWAIENFNATHN